MNSNRPLLEELQRPQVAGGGDFGTSGDGASSWTEGSALSFAADVGDSCSAFSSFSSWRDSCSASPAFSAFSGAYPAALCSIEPPLDSSWSKWTFVGSPQELGPVGDSLGALGESFPFSLSKS